MGLLRVDGWMNRWMDELPVLTSVFECGYHSKTGLGPDSYGTVVLADTEARRIPLIFTISPFLVYRV
jgi:hypothetical protein